MAEDRLKKLYPQGMEAARKASRDMADEEFWTEVNNRLPPDSRFGGLYGLLPYLGLGRGENRAKVGTFMMRPEFIIPRGPEDEEYTRTNLGGYYVPSSDKEDVTRKNDAFNTLLQFIGEGPAPGEGPNVFQTFENTKGARKYRDTRMEGGKRSSEYGNEPGGFNQVLIHETAHRGMDSPAMRDFIKEKYQERAQRLRDNENAIMKKYRSDIVLDYPYLDYATDTNNEYYVRDALPTRREHEVWASQFESNPDKRESIQTLQDEFKRWLTPEKAKRYGIRLPSPSAEPKSKIEMTFDDIINFLGGR